MNGNCSRSITWPLTGNTVYLQSGSYLASSTSIDIDSKWGGAKTFFSKEGLFMLKCSGIGDLVVSSYGAVQAVDLAPGQTYTVDTGHMVGWHAGVSYEVKKVGNWKSTMLRAFSTTRWPSAVASKKREDVECGILSRPRAG